ncbi:hypothetical protein, partial [Denitratimonas sp. CY0512]|uniref:hypothetical protein n=1 Tax=Denitratimonas sp. CY0512 TaxID=3131940 RepID=UPI00309A8E09
MIARHFPTIEQISHLAATTASSPFPFGIELEEPEANPEWREACRHGPADSTLKCNFLEPKRARCRRLGRST